MDSSPSKRRKTSPTTSIRVNESNTNTRSVSQDGDRDSGRRASFMSPTKATLARFNPSLLPPSKATELRRPRSSGSQGSDSRGPSKRDSMSGAAYLGMRTASPKLSTQTNGTTPEDGMNGNGYGLVAAPRRTSWTPGRNNTPSKKAKLTVAHDSRASPPEEAKEERNEVQQTQVDEQGLSGDIINTESRFLIEGDGTMVAGASHLPSTPRHFGTFGATSGMIQHEDGEPSLPSAPVHLEIELPPERPTGLAFNSPGKRPKRKGKNARSPPLKPKDPAPEQPVQILRTPASSLGPRIYIANAPNPPPTAQENSLVNMRERLTRLEKQLMVLELDLVRQLLVSQWQSDRKKEAKGISKAKKEVLAISAKMVRSQEEMRRLVSSTTSELRNQGITDIIPIESSVADILPKSPKPKSLSQRLAHFLPFSGRIPPPKPKPPSLQGLDTSQLLDLDSHDDSTTPITVEVSNAMLIDSPPDALSQRYVIALSSPSQLLTVKMQVIISIVSQMVTQLQVLDVSSWAEQELGTWLRAGFEERSLEVIGTVFERYWILCVQRLKCWKASSRNLKDLIADRGDLSRIPLHMDTADPSDLIEVLSQQTLSLVRDDVALDVTWHISTKDDGEVESHVSARPKFPDTWRRTEIGAELSKVGQAFDMLVKDRGVTEAITVFARLMFPN